MILDAETTTMLESARQRSLNRDWRTIEEVAAILGVSVRTIRRREAAGLMPTRFKRSRRLNYRLSDIRSLFLPGD